LLIPSKNGSAKIGRNFKFAKHLCIFLSESKYDFHHLLFISITRNI